MTQGLKTRHFQLFIQSYSSLQLLQNTFTGSKYLVSNWSYSRLIRTIKKVKKSNKKFKIFCVIIILCNHYFIILNLFLAIKSFILCQIKQTALKLGYNFTTYSKFTNTGWINKLQTWKPLSRIWASSSISRKRQATGLEPLCHIASGTSTPESSMISTKRRPIS